MSERSIGLDQALQAYVVAVGTPPDEVLRDLAAETRDRVPERASMQIAPEQGALLTLLTALARPRFAVEVGTFTGYSSICIARGLPPGGHLLCCDSSVEWTAIATRYWERAGVADRIELRLGDARETLRALPDEPIDFAFVDADKPGYPDYYEELIGRLAPDGLIVVDNTLAGGRVLDPAPDDGTAIAIAAFNTHVAADPRTWQVLLPVADGVTLIRRRGVGAP